ncbi:lipopolysaccharide biosynthesis protein [Desulfuromonas sp. DDH964]|uniref:lipopolysaccharide biosynthesis protein n=1 Tax=Desulfuromonas sp. DDH964 TaxID=1823759 RepID=UPI00078DC9B5|nr:oligosaccharide flippase family protein [Desulfuromonas sp. DDH964]AMV71862.1 undecaprenyl-diphospho-oligosaccharide flippase [Desulfuromonas sp. DDH964]
MKGFSLTAFIAITGSAFPFLLLPILTRALTKEQYGELVVIELCLAILTTLIHFSISGSTVEYYKMDEESLKNYLSMSLYLSFFSFIILQVFVLTFGDIIYKNFQVSKMWLAVIPLMAFMNVSTKLQNILHVCKRNHLSYAIFLLAPNALIFISTIIFLYIFGLGYEAKLYSILISFFLFGISSFFLLFKAGFISFDFKKKYLPINLSFTIPLLIHSLVASLYFSADRLFLSKMIGNNAVAIYAAGFQVAAVMSVLQHAFSTPWHPLVMELLSEKSVEKYGKKHVFTKLIKNTILSSMIMVFIAVFLIIVVYYFINIILPHSYEESKGVSIIIIISYCILGFYKIVSPILWYYNRTSTLSRITIFVFFVNMLFNYILISKYNVMGACYATLISVSIQFILTTIISCNILYNDFVLFEKNKSMK